MDDLIIIQARMSSTRLPDKVLKPIWNGACLLDLLLGKLRNQKPAFVLATTVNTRDDALVDWAKTNDVPYFRGSESDVLQRFIACAHEFKARNIIRVCSDNPFLQLDQVSHYLRQLRSGVDYISYCNSEGLPAIKTHWGLYVEGVSLSALEKTQTILANHDEQRFYQEHVTNFIYGHPDQFEIKLERAPGIIANRKNLRFTIDTPLDLENTQKILNRLGGDNQSSLNEIIKLVDQDNDILNNMKEGIAAFSK